MSLKSRLARLEGVVEPGRNVHVVNLTTWCEEELKAYDEASDEERRGILKAHIPDLREDDIVVLSSIPRPRDEESEP